MPELRRDPIIGRWVIVSTERGKRPSDFDTEILENDSVLCPFCPGNEQLTPAEITAYRKPGSLRDKDGWWLRVVPNKFPALQVEGQLNKTGMGMYDKMNGIGAHEVIIETPDHHKNIDQLDDKNVEDIIWICRDRIIDLKKDPRFAYILIFKNSGRLAGASLTHPHTQLIATPIVPKQVSEELNGGKGYYGYKERCVFCDIIKQEIAQGQRLVCENDDFIAFEPFSSRFPFETWIIPKKHSSDFEDIQKYEVVNFSFILKNTLSKINNVLEHPPYNYLLHNSPVRESNLPHFHWHLEIIPKLTRLAGFEWGTGLYINPTPPEEAAKFLRES
ncbi:MAG: galactose-1-phosphate uridylyltransferase [bacterium]